MGHVSLTKESAANWPNSRPTFWEVPDDVQRLRYRPGGQRCKLAPADLATDPPVGQATPLNLRAELALHNAFSRHAPRAPDFKYAAKRYDDVIETLERGAETLIAQTSDALGTLYAERMTELAIEARLCGSAGKRASSTWPTAATPAGTVSTRMQTLCAKRGFAPNTTPMAAGRLQRTPS